MTNVLWRLLYTFIYFRQLFNYNFDYSAAGYICDAHHIIMIWEVTKGFPQLGTYSWYKV